MRRDVAALINLTSYFVVIFVVIQLEGGFAPFLIACLVGALFYVSTTVLALVFSNPQLKAPVDDAADAYRISIIILALLALAAIVFGAALRSGA